ncbi:MAG: GNAT family N-acetyltransferase [Elainellaceae cyanobacterium]
MTITQANLTHLDTLAVLFDQYRVFYQQPPNLQGAKAFLSDRLKTGDSVIFLALNGETALGFTQLYPSFSSVAMQPIWILNDLYVEAQHRSQGVASALMDAAETYARQTGAVRVALSTQTSNSAAQALYQSRGYQQDAEFYHYALPL